MLSSSFFASKAVQSKILLSSIDEDQCFVIDQWLNTFKHNPMDDIATNMAKLMLACVAKGNLKTRSMFHENGELTDPPNVLKATDYISHASRIILDYRQLSDDNQRALLHFFPTSSPRVQARSATHAVKRTNNEVSELKGLMIGVYGQLPIFLRQAYDFGVNIAMGGLQQLNFVGREISDNGYSGHMYFHHNEEEQLLMLGLEQSAPSSSVLEIFFPNPEPNDNTQFGHDQFRQGHSLVGASDTFTAAGSLYFSDPVYQAKLLAEKQVAPPNKYGGMHVTLTDDNWQDIISYIESLNGYIKADDDAAVRKLLSQCPQTATDKAVKVKSYLLINFNDYFHRIQQLLDERDLETSDTHAIEQLKNEVIKFQRGDIHLYESVIKKINTLVLTTHLPEGYQKALSRIKALLSCQRSLDPNLEVLHKDLLIEHERNESSEKIDILLDNLSVLKKFFESMRDVQPSEIQGHLEKIDNKYAQLKRYKNTLEKNGMTEITVDDRLDASDSSQHAWVMVKTLSFEELQEVEQCINDTKQLILKFSGLIVQYDKGFKASTQSKCKRAKVTQFHEQGQLTSEHKLALNADEDQNNHEVAQLNDKEVAYIEFVKSNPYYEVIERELLSDLDAWYIRLKSELGKELCAANFLYIKMHIERAVKNFFIMRSYVNDSNLRSIHCLVKQCISEYVTAPWSLPEPTAVSLIVPVLRDYLKKLDEIGRLYNLTFYSHDNHFTMYTPAQSGEKPSATFACSSKPVGIAKAT